MPTTNALTMEERVLTATCVAHIDLSSVRHNYQLIQEKVGENRHVLAVVKADAYGLGMAKVAKTLSLAGCTRFVVAFPEEGVLLRNILKDAQIYVLSGAWAGLENLFLLQNLIPVINDEDSLRRWHALGKGAPCALHMDTGMARTGFEAPDFENLIPFMKELNVVCLMSHYANSEDANHPFNETQRSRFETFHALLPHIPTCLANSCALSLKESFWGDFVRPGLSLYGLSGENAHNQGLKPAVRVGARIVQIRNLTVGQSVGYGSTWRACRPTRLATLAMGYADGLLRALSNQGYAWIKGAQVPFVGRVSMDFATLDVSDVPPHEASVGDFVDLFYDAKSLHHLALQAHTTPHEFLVGLSSRCARVYKD
jgi:alanine racemase